MQMTYVKGQYVDDICQGGSMQMTYVKGQYVDETVPCLVFPGVSVAQLSNFEWNVTSSDLEITKI